MTDEFSCDECGQSFDSERGLHIHRGRVHKDEGSDQEDVPDQDTNPAEQQEGVVAHESDGRVTLSLPVFHALGAVFVVGVVFGGFVMGAAAQVSPTGALSDDAALSLAQAMEDQTGTTGSPSESGPGSESQGTTDTGSGDTGSSPTVQVSKISLEDEPTLGDSDAPVTIVEFTDLQCPFCTMFDNRTFDQIRNNYIETGDVRYVVKDFPIPQLGHNQAPLLAEAGKCAYEQDMYWEFKDKIMDEQMAMAPRGTARFEDSQVTEWVRAIGLDMEQYSSCMESADGSEWEQDKQEGNSFSATVGGSPFISGTPSFVVYRTGAETGTPLVGAQPYSAFESEIQSKLDG